MSRESDRAACTAKLKALKGELNVYMARAMELGLDCRITVARPAADKAPELVVEMVEKL